MVRTASLLFLAAATVATVAHAEDPAKPASDPQKIICKRQLATGSLVQATRICHTREEWQLLGEQNRAEADRLQQQSYRQGTNG